MDAFIVLVGTLCKTCSRLVKKSTTPKAKVNQRLTIKGTYESRQLMAPGRVVPALIFERFERDGQSLACFFSGRRVLRTRIISSLASPRAKQTQTCSRCFFSSCLDPRGSFVSDRHVPLPMLLLVLLLLSLVWASTGSDQGLERRNRLHLLRSFAGELHG